MPKHVAVWLDHKEARIFHIDPHTIDEATVLAPLHNIHDKHPVGPEGPHEHPEDATRFLHAVADALDGSEEILVVGPGATKHELVKYVNAHHRALASKLVGVETVDHPSDRQLIAYAKKYFIMNDRTG
jgi:stalled ribosome rescue protein Dom34